MLYRIKNEIIVVVVSFFIVMCFFGKIVLKPNDYLLQWEHDGTSTYYTSLFYIDNDSEDNFRGMNYPYGENLFLVTGHYSFTKVFKFFNKVTDSPNNFVGFLNLFILLSIPLGSLIIYKILLYYKAPSLVSIGYSIIIGFMSPQIGLIAGYYKYGCIFIFPFFWYIFIKYFEKDNYMIWGVIYVLFTTFWMSVYFSLFGSIFFLLFYISNLLFNKSKKHFFKSWKFNLYSLFCLLLPLIALKTTLTLDIGSFNDRIKIPSGADYLGFPVNLWPKYIFDFPQIRLFFNVKPLKWIGITYFGFLGTFFLIIYIISLILKKYSKHKFFKEITILPSKFSTSLFVAFLVFIISTNILYHTKIFELIPILNPFQQLRGFTRLSYFIYFPITIFSIIIMLNTIKYLTTNRPVTAKFLFVLFTLFWGFEAAFNLYAARSYIFLQNETHNARDFLGEEGNYLQILEEKNYNSNDFSCVLSLPFSSQGSEKLRRVNEESFYQSFKASYNLSLPMIGGLMNRSSITQAANSFQLFSDPHIKKEILNDFISQKPILIIKNKDYSISKNEERLVSKSSSFFKGKTFDLYCLELDSIKILEKEFYNIAKNIDSLYLNHNKETLISITNKAFEEHDNSNKLIGNGSFYLEKGSVTLVDTIIYEDSDLNISFWMFLDDRKYGLPKISIVNSNGSYQIDPLESFCIYKNWIRVEHTLNTGMVKAFKLKIEGDFISIDNLVIKKDGADFIQKIDKKYIYNNYIIEN